MPLLRAPVNILFPRGEETAILGSWEENSPGPQKNFPKKSKIWEIFLFPSLRFGKFCPILAILHHWGRKNPKFLRYAPFLVNI